MPTFTVLELLADLPQPETIKSGSNNRNNQANRLNFFMIQNPPHYYAYDFQQLNCDQKKKSAPNLIETNFVVVPF